MDFNPLIQTYNYALGSETDSELKRACLSDPVQICFKRVEISTALTQNLRESIPGLASNPSIQFYTQPNPNLATDLSGGTSSPLWCKTYREDSHRNEEERSQDVETGIIQLHKQQQHPTSLNCSYT